MIRAAAFLLAFSIPVNAQVYVPPECAELATREGLPSDVMTRAQAAKAKVKLVRLSNLDPLVSGCREAIARAKAASNMP